MRRLLLIASLAFGLSTGCSRSTTSRQNEETPLAVSPQPAPIVVQAPSTKVIEVAVEKAKPAQGRRADMLLDLTSQFEVPLDIEPLPPVAVMGLFAGSPSVLIHHRWDARDELFIAPPPAVLGMLAGGSSLRSFGKRPVFDLTIEDIDPGIELNYNADRVPEVSVPGVVEAEPAIGIIGEPAPKRGDILPPPGHGAIGVPSGTIGDIGIGGLSGRSGATRTKLIEPVVGNVANERAVADALTWIAKQQKADGSWEFDGTAKPNKSAATGMALLTFLAAKETHREGKKYKVNVTQGLAYLLSQQKENGQIGDDSHYTHGIGTIVLAEAFGMTNDPLLRRKAQAAVDFIVKAQAKDGGWRYTLAADTGDTSITGWQLQALKSAQLAGLVVPQQTLKNVGKFLDSVAKDGGSQFGYTAGSPGTPTLSAVGLLARLYLGMAPTNDALAKGVQMILEKARPETQKTNVYYLYYGTLLLKQVGGDAFAKDWHPALRDLLVKTQITAQERGADVGSWPKDGSFIGSCCGKLGTTCMSTLCLEVYYRHLSLFQREK